MFNTPIYATQLSTLEEVKAFSYDYGRVLEVSDDRSYAKTFCQNNGQIAICDEFGFVLVTPYRSEIASILAENGFTEKSFFVPFSNHEELPARYLWLKKIAEEENWAETYCMAKTISNRKGIKEVYFDHTLNFKITEIDTIFNEISNPCHPNCKEIIYKPMVMTYLMNDTDKNVGTYIIGDKKTLIICDEYGRTFMLKAKTIINQFVNILITAGYIRNPHPEYYITFVPAEDSNKS